MSDYDDTEQWEQDQEQRAIFFDEKASEFKLKEVRKRFEELDGANYKWDRKELNIGKEAWRNVIHSELRPIEAFCHPEVITESKYLVLYFQFLSMLSGKSISHIGFSSDFETNYSRFQEDSEDAEEYSRRINEIITTLIENKPESNVERENVTIWRAMQAGSTSGGKWRNKKGDLEEIRLKRRVFREFQQRGYISDEKEYGSAFGFDVPLKNSNHELHFKSEPDMGIKKAGSEKYEIIVEIKGGIDPAGVLERFGAIEKSFKNELSKNQNIETFLTIQRAAYTDESKKRINESDLIDHHILINGLNEEDYEQAARRFVEVSEDLINL